MGKAAALMCLVIKLHMKQRSWGFYFPGIWESEQNSERGYH